jgi:hypothetical protein
LLPEWNELRLFLSLRDSNPILQVDFKMAAPTQLACTFTLFVPSPFSIPFDIVRVSVVDGLVEWIGDMAAWNIWLGIGLIGR